MKIAPWEEWIIPKTWSTKQLFSRWKIERRIRFILYSQLAPFSIDTTPRCWGGRTPFLGLLHFTLDTYLIMLSVKQGGNKYHFLKVFRMIRPGIEPRSPRPLANSTKQPYQDSFGVWEIGTYIHKLRGGLNLLKKNLPLREVSMVDVTFAWKKRSTSLDINLVGNY